MFAERWGALLPWASQLRCPVGEFLSFGAFHSLANKADLWLRVRPGSDGARALGLANVMIERNWYDRHFVSDWSNGPHLVRADTGRMLTERDRAPDGDARRLLAWGKTDDSL